jgi:DNA primase
MKIDLPEVLEALNLENITEKQEEVFFSCPFPEHWRGDKNPSSSINKETLAYYCFSCGRKGTLYTLISQLKGISPNLAVRWIKNQYPQPEEEENFLSRLARMLQPATPDAPYIDEDHLEGFRVKWSKVLEAYEDGSCPPSLAYVFDQGLTVKTLVDNGIGYDEHSRRITFPYRDKSGHLVGFKGRATKDGVFPKYKILGNADYNFPMLKVKDHVYGLDTAEGHLIVVEGEKDALILRQKGFPGAVAVGSCQLTDAQARLLKMHGQPITILFDPDEAGKNGAKKAAQAIAPNVVVRIGQLDLVDPADATEEQIIKALTHAKDAIQLMYIEPKEYANA